MLKASPLRRLCVSVRCPVLLNYAVCRGQALDVWKPSKSFSCKADTVPDFRCAVPAFAAAIVLFVSECHKRVHHLMCHAWCLQLKLAPPFQILCLAGYASPVTSFRARLHWPAQQQPMQESRCCMPSSSQTWTSSSCRNTTPMMCGRSFSRWLTVGACYADACQLVALFTNLSFHAADQAAPRIIVKTCC